MKNHQFKEKVEQSEVFQSFPKFKQDIYLGHKVLSRLEDLHGQAERLGINYIKQNPSLTISDINLINSILNDK